MATLLQELALQGLVILILSFSVWRLFRPRNQHSFRSVAILVLGDIGRSPRMMYHAQSFAETGFVTDIIGYGGSQPIPALARLPTGRVRIRLLPELPKIISRLPFLILAPIKIVVQVASILLWLLVWIDAPPEFIVVQNPPSIPTLALVQLVARIRGSKVIIDWHNLGYSILALKLGKEHILVRIAKRFEGTFGHYAYAHLFVTYAMRDALVKEWDLQGHKVVLHDRPPSNFHRSTVQEVHDLFLKLHPILSLDETLVGFLPESSNPPYKTVLTEIKAPDGGASSVLPKTIEPIGQPTTMYTQLASPSLRADRPAVLVSSTSWTADEDFGILLKALVTYNAQAEELSSRTESSHPNAHEKLPKLLVIVTGKGPLRDQYMAEIKKLQKSWNWVRCISLWLEAADYPILLGSADLGVCLHFSSSGLDLPMKVVDMFGCGLPVCAVDYPCLNELVKNGKNGLVFRTHAHLALQLEELFLSFPNVPYLRSMSTNLANGSSSLSKSPQKRYSPAADDEDVWCTWEENWTRVMKPLVFPSVSLQR